MEPRSLALWVSEAFAVLTSVTSCLCSAVFKPLVNGTGHHRVMLNGLKLDSWDLDKFSSRNLNETLERLELS